MKITKLQFNLANRAQSTALMHERELKSAQHVAQLSAQHFHDILAVVASGAGIPDGTPASRIVLKETPEGEYSLEVVSEPTPTA